MLQNKQMTFLLAVAFVAVMAGCKHEELVPSGAQVLKAQIEGGATRTSYDSVEGKFAWTAGDEIAIHYSNGSYQTLAVNPVDGSVQAQASTTSRQRDYYAIYPASVADASNYGNTTLKVTLPTSYDLTDIVSGAAGNPGWDYSPVPLVAVNDETTCLLDFFHTGGLLRILCSGLDQNTQKLEVTFDKDVTGSYTVTYVTDELAREVPTITTGGTSSNNKVTFQLAAAGSSIGAEPDPANPRVFVLNVPVPCGTYNSVTVSSYKSDGSFQSSRTFDTKPLVFSRHRGKKLEIGELSFTFFLGSYVNGTIVQLSNINNMTYVGGARTLSENFVSFKTDGTDLIPVPFRIEYSLDDGITWIAQGEEGAPDWISSSSSVRFDGNVPGADPLPFALDIKQIPNSIPNEHHIELSGRTPIGTEEAPFDLSTINVATGETVPTTTANCYVVQAPGYYKFPVVYGNAVQNGSEITATYQRQIGSGNMNILVDHLGNDISSAYILEHLSSHEYNFTAKIFQVEGSPSLVTNAVYHANDPDDTTDDYISFMVPADYIAQGNASIALFNENDEVVWSWQIWVTDEDLTRLISVTDNNGTPVSSIAPVDLGRVESVEHQYIGRDCLFRVIQIDPNGITLSQNSVQQAGRSFTEKVHNPLYQDQRKDPYFSLSTNYYPYGNTYSPKNVSPTTIDYYIRCPWARSAGDIYYSGSFVNILWNTQGGIRTPVIKTIYDPCPVGFRVPLASELTPLQGNLLIEDSSLTNPVRRVWFDVNGNGEIDAGIDTDFPCRGGLSRYSLDPVGDGTCVALCVIRGGWAESGFALYGDNLALRRAAPMQLRPVVD